MPTTTQVEIVTTTQKPERRCPYTARRLHRDALENGWTSELRLCSYAYSSENHVERVELRAHGGLYAVAANWELPATWESPRWRCSAAQVRTRRTFSQSDWHANAHEFTPTPDDTLTYLKERIFAGSESCHAAPKMLPVAHAYDAMVEAYRNGASTIPDELRDRVLRCANDCRVAIAGLNEAEPGARKAAIRAQRARRAARETTNPKVPQRTEAHNIQIT